MYKLAHYLGILLLSISVSQTLAVEPPTITATPDEDLNQLSKEILLEHTNVAVNALTAIHAHLTELVEQEKTLTQEIEAKTVEKTAFKLPSLPPVTDIITDPEQAQLFVKAHETQLTALQQLSVLLKSLQGLTKKHQEVALKLANENKLLADAQTKYLPLATALIARKETGELTTEQVPDNVLKSLTNNEQPVLLEKVNQWQAQAARDEVIIADSETQLKTLAEQQTQVETASKKAVEQLQEASQRAEWRKDFNSRQLTDLIAFFNTRFNTWNTTVGILNEQTKLLTEKVTGLTAQQTALEKATPPDSSQFTVTDEPVKSLQEAKQNLLIAQANQTFREQQFAELNTINTTLQELSGKLGQDTEQADKLLKEGIELVVLTEVIQSLSQTESGQKTVLPEAITQEVIQETVTVVRGQADMFKTQQTNFMALADTLKKQLEDANTALTEAKTIVVTGEKHLEWEKEWVAFLKEVEKLTNDELISSFQGTLTQIVDIQKQAETQTLETDKSRQALEKNMKALTGHKDPVALDNIKREQEFTQWYSEQNIHLDPPVKQVAVTDTPTTSSSVKTTTDTTPTTTNATTTTSTTTTVSPTVSATTPTVEATPAPTAPAKRQTITEEAIETAQTQMEKTVVRYLRTVQEWRELRQTVLTQLTEHEQKVKTLLQRLEEQLSLARRAWGSATLLQTKASQGEIAQETLPPTIKTWVSREQVLTLQTAITTLETELTSLQKQRDSITANTLYEGYLKPLQTWRDSLAQQIGQLQERLGLENNYTPPDVKTMEEFEKNKHEREVSQRIEADRDLYEKFLGGIVGKHTEELDQLLYGYYERLISLEYQYNNLEERKKRTQALIKLAEARRPMFEELEQQVRNTLNVAETQFDVEQTKVKTVFFPAKTTNLLSELKERTDISLEVNELPKLPLGVDEQALYESKVLLVNKLLEPFVKVLGYRAWLTDIRQQRVELGGIDTEVGKLKEEVAGLESKQQELQRQIYKLTGFPASVLDKITKATDTPLSQNERNQLLTGEINPLREDRLTELNWATVRTLGWLVLIPFIAFLSIKIMYLFGKRTISRASHPDEDPNLRKEREERVKILFHVFSTAWTILVVVLSVIYMFKAVNVDVLPLLASAGILGLAIAFGAQRLVSDFFSGFFILLENQFKTGDLVTIDHVTGNVERVTPRLTIVRDTLGRTHYFPNGSIDHVYNHVRGWEAINIEIPVPYEVPTEQVFTYLQQTIDEMKSDEKLKRLILAMTIRGINEFDDYAVRYQLWIKALPDEQFGVAREFRRRIKKLFDNAGIKMPQRMGIVIQKDPT
ncbi:mechanosensitive ion channel domain-containing protein [Beggiatoa leptomitoformis]|uniref:Mechanosensitive ion channel n=1 Tax=Beggiatoa leptomitoformis TaxID=288004 RepID=A0A2N9YDG4_9GAMM|nr:mechanosensitive ion channel domain-containing protein [Beggiatoa leptomitoformis]AUI68527.1 mechanosensitive ion channel [Beggiatoa leptomitoformis]QGX03840.1 mechanosensitive ion channel [Beggiatoa leptomitoformis]